VLTFLNSCWLPLAGSFCEQPCKRSKKNCDAHRVVRLGDPTDTGEDGGEEAVGTVRPADEAGAEGVGAV
jgi:hypothetical protein